MKSFQSKASQKGERVKGAAEGETDFSERVRHFVPVFHKQEVGLSFWNGILLQN